jgi:hypothetical protein
LAPPSARPLVDDAARLADQVRSIDPGAPTLTVVVTPISVLMRSLQLAGHRVAFGRSCCGSSSTSTCSSSSMPERVTTSWYWPDSAPCCSTSSSICVGKTLTPRMISMSSLRPTILPMRRMLRAVGGSSRVRSRVR